jgi:glycosyltransferase involved in cell wall biosynthesis
LGAGIFKFMTNNKQDTTTGNLRILYLSQYFPPEVGATQTRAHEMAHGLVQAGHHVTMITEVPNHPAGIIPPEYQGKWYESTNLDGIDVIRVWVKTAPVKTFRTRMAFYLSFMVMAIGAGLFLARGKFDVIYATSPPLFVGGAALVLSYLRRIPLVFEVRDLWPESAVVLGELTNRRAIALADWLERACYHRATRVVVVTHGIRDRLLQRGYPAQLLALIPNGANTNLFTPQPQAGQRIRRELGLDNHFVVLYAGIHGIAQGLEWVLQAAHQLIDDARIQFVFVGDGPCKTDLLRLKDELALTNVTMLDARPREVIPAYLSAANLSLVPLRRLELFKGALPSKMFDAWACACPVLLSIDGEARQVLDLAQGGVFVEPESVIALVTAIRRLAVQPELGLACGANGRQFVERHYSRQAQARQLTDLLTGLNSQS